MTSRGMMAQIHVAVIHHHTDVANGTLSRQHNSGNFKGYPIDPYVKLIKYSLIHQ